MIVGDQISEWLQMSEDEKEVRVHKKCERAVVQKCRRACARAALNPCIDACLRVVATPGVSVIGLTSILNHVVKTRDKLLQENEHRSEKEQRALSVLTNNCLKTCVSGWAKEWTAFCEIAFKRICIRMCTNVCKRRCRRSCKYPCTRTPSRQLYRRGKAQLRVGMCLLYCVAACMYSCMKACKTLVPAWLNVKGRHICRPVLAETSRRLAREWEEENINREREGEASADNLNIRNHGTL